MPNYKLSLSYLLVIIGLFLYSYTQVDLNLTLSEISIWQTIQKSFQYIGWFQRPLSTFIYLAIITLLTIYYGIFLWLAKNNKLEYRQLWFIIGATSIILLFSYNAFSYDLFNYMFDAKIVTYYQQNPYEHKALDYPQDPWINFMRWTHRIYPYGPLWLFLTIPLSFIGFQVFLPTLFLFKSLAVASFFGTTYYIGRILKHVSPRHALLGMVFFGLNPLVIIESLVSAHNDIVMMFFAVAALAMVVEKKYMQSVVFFIASVGIKFATIFLFPLFIYLMFLQYKKKNINYQKVFLFAGLAMVIPIILSSIRTELQPWYLLWIIPLFTLLVHSKYVMAALSIVSVGLLLHYAPFLYQGDWNPPVPKIKGFLTGSSVALSFLLLLYSLIRKNHTV